ncbi:UNVERIFIED_CONTAM: hypothetical protein FKN15_025398 [Acipenser sinensis]
MKDEEKLRAFVHKVDSKESLLRKQTRMTENDDIDTALYAWFVQQRTQGTPLSGPILQAKAQDLAK